MPDTTYSEKRVLNYTPEQLFNVVADVKSYPEFLPWCIGARIVSQDDKEMIADLIIGYKFIREKFRSRVILDKPSAIKVEYVSGPLSSLTNEWKFNDNGDGTTTIDFYVSFEFKNPLLRKLVELFFDEIIKRMVAAFEQRANDLYGSTPNIDQK